MPMSDYIRRLRTMVGTMVLEVPTVSVVGDKLSRVSTAFAGKPVGDTLRPDGEETLEVRYFDRDETLALRYKPHVRMFTDAGYSPDRIAHFQRPTRQPPSP